MLKLLFFSALLLTLCLRFQAVAHGGAYMNHPDKSTKLKGSGSKANVEADLTRSIQSPVFKHIQPESLFTQQLSFLFGDVFTEISTPKVFSGSCIGLLYQLLLFPFHAFW
jgi:hypothetical protein